ncbi:MAG: response regulator transcription factor [Bacteroidales bacterium]
MAEQPVIIVCDDEQDILEFISYNLRKEGYVVYTCNNGREAIEMAKEHNPDLIILDIMMPEMDGVEACEEIRRIPELKDVIITFLTARSEDYSQVAGFEAGADDYISKPIKPKVFVSRIAALLKRSRRRGAGGDNSLNLSPKIELSNLVIDRERYVVYKDGEELNLPKKEFELLSLLASKPGKVMTREEIYSSIWGESVVVGDRTIDVHIRKLREKVGSDIIVTVKGIGYKTIEDKE